MKLQHWFSRPGRPPLLDRYAAPAILLTSLWLVLVDNGSLWSLVNGLPGSPGLPQGWITVTMFLFTVALVNLLLTLFAFGRATRWILGAFLIVSAAIAYFMNHYGIMLDTGMIENVFETDRAEALELLNFGLVWRVLLFGVLPAALVWRLAPRRQRVWDVVLEKSTMALVSLAVIAIAVGPFFKDYVSLVRNHRQIRYLVTPANLLDSTYGYVAEALKSPVTITPVGEDATRGDHLKAVQRPVVTVLVVGETARADHFSLNGYERETNPELAARHVVYFEDVSSCGTATAVSLPCMFSDLTRADYSKSGAKSRDGLLDVVSRAGFRTEWLDNNAGCKGVCDHADTWISEGMDTEGMCADGECYDDILLDKLDESLARTNPEQGRDRLIVLHQNGSHGPAYYRRYPDAFRHFTPDCRSDEFSDCSREEIVNSYDNTIYYTDHFLARIIEKLDGYSGRMDTALLYVSDHGESLGEYGLYLHGTPYMLAPSSQTHVPMLFWMSSAYREDFGVDPKCLDSRRAAHLSHDFLFHSVLGMLDITTTARDRHLDLFDGCLSAPTGELKLADASTATGPAAGAAGGARQQFTAVGAASRQSR